MVFQHWRSTVLRGWLLVNTDLLLHTTTQQKRSSWALLQWETDWAIRDICRAPNKETHLNQTLLYANGALSQMTYGELLNLSW